MMWWWEFLLFPLFAFGYVNVKNDYVDEWMWKKIDREKNNLFEFREEIACVMDARFLMRPYCSSVQILLPHRVVITFIRWMMMMVNGFLLCFTFSLSVIRSYERTHTNTQAAFTGAPTNRHVNNVDDERATERRLKIADEKDTHAKGTQYTQTSISSNSSSSSRHRRRRCHRTSCFTLNGNGRVGYAKHACGCWCCCCCFFPERTRSTLDWVFNSDSKTFWREKKKQTAKTNRTTKRLSYLHCSYCNWLCPILMWCAVLCYSFCRSHSLRPSLFYVYFSSIHWDAEENKLLAVSLFFFFFFFDFLWMKLWQQLVNGKLLLD